MKKILLSIVALGCFSVNAQTTLLSEGFETYEDFAISGFGGWVTLDLDQLETYTGGTPTAFPPTWPNAGEPQAFQVFNPLLALVMNSTDACSGNAETRNFDPHTGLKYAASWAGVPTATVTGNNDWLVSPPLTLGTSANTLKFWVKSMSPCYGLETYRAYVYTGTDVPTSAANFTQLGGTTNLTAPVTWEEKTFSLDAYQGQTVRIAIRCTSADHYMFMVDDISVTTAALGVNDVLASKFALYPNPADSQVTVSFKDNIAVNEIKITDLNGRVVKTSNYTGALNSVQLNISDLSAGVYMMNINSDQGTAVKKIVKK